MNIRNEIKAYIVREGFTMSELVEKLAEQYGWSPSVPNLSDKLRRESLRYKEAVELADALGYDLVWQKRREGGVWQKKRAAVSISKLQTRNGA